MSLSKEEIRKEFEYWIRNHQTIVIELTRLQELAVFDFFYTKLEVKDIIKVNLEERLAEKDKQLSEAKEEIEKLTNIHEEEIQGYIKRQRDGFNEAQLHYGEYRAEIARLTDLLKAAEGVISLLQSIPKMTDLGQALKSYNALKAKQ